MYNKRKFRQQKETYIHDIGDILVRPIVNAKPRAISLSVWLEKMFHVDEREIYRFEVIKPFKMPGELKVTNGFKMLQGVGPTWVREGVVLIVRTDKRYPEIVDVEGPIGVGRKDLWYQMSDIDFIRIKSNLFRDSRRSW